MDLMSAITSFFVIWWTVLFAVLPWGNQPPAEPMRGTAPSAPDRPRLGLKFLITTGISVLCWLLLWLVVEYSGFSFRSWAAHWS